MWAIAVVTDAKWSCNLHIRFIIFINTDNDKDF